MPGGKSSYPTYMWDIAKLFILSHTPHWDTPVGRLRCQFVPPPSKHFHSLSSWFSRPRPLYVLHFHHCQFQTRGEMALPFRKALGQLDQVGVDTRTIKELSRELWQLLLKAKRAGNHMRYTSFRHFKTVSNKKKTCVTCSDRDVAFSVTPPLIFAFKMPLYSNNVWGWTRSRGT